MKRARDTHLYPRDLDNPADYVPQPGEIEIPPGDERDERINIVARRRCHRKND
jgi:hypothetical protein